jgi:phosphoserine phosphatase
LLIAAHLWKVQYIFGSRIDRGGAIMKVRALLTDFDGTLVTRDILDIVCGIVGKEEESRRLNEEFIAGKREGLPTLMARINFLKGVSLNDIDRRLSVDDFLVKGARQLFAYLRSKNITSILHSGNIVPVLEYYRNLLGIDYVVGTKPKMNKDCIDSIGIDDFSGRDFKLVGCSKILEKLGIPSSDVIALGDAPSDRQIFEFVSKSIAINSKGGIEKYSNFVIKDDLSDVIEIIETLKLPN